MTAPSFLVLGTDAVLAAAPATPVQLAHACLAAGYSAVIPASWGDELIAERALRALSNSNAPLIQCSCPLVRRRLTARSDDIDALAFSSVAPPVAAALYLRALHVPLAIHVTFTGSCPSGSHDSIDVWLSPDELLRDLARRGIRVSAQPTEFDSVLPPDRRRHFSEAGGIPSQVALRGGQGTDVIEVRNEDFAVELAQHLLSGTRSLVDVAVAVGCACSGAVSGANREVARARVRELEPPRSPSPIVDHLLPIPIGTDAPALPPSPPATAPAETGLVRGAADPTSSTRAPGLAADAFDPSSGSELPGEAGVALAGVASDPSRRRSPSGASRAVLGSMPQSRSTGRQLPRAYVARRRSSPGGLRQSGVRRQEVILTPRFAFRPRWAWVTTLTIALVALIALAIAAFWPRGG